MTLNPANTPKPIGSTLSDLPGSDVLIAAVACPVGVPLPLGEAVGADVPEVVAETVSVADLDAAAAEEPALPVGAAEDAGGGGAADAVGKREDGTDVTDERPCGIGVDDQYENHFVQGEPRCLQSPTLLQMRPFLS